MIYTMGNTLRPVNNFRNKCTHFDTFGAYPEVKSQCETLTDIDYCETICRDDCPWNAYC